jgi:hypothetical protein
MASLKSYPRRPTEEAENFPSREVILRPVGAVLAGQDHEWTAAGTQARNLRRLRRTATSPETDENDVTIETIFDLCLLESGGRRALPLDPSSPPPALRRVGAPRFGCAVFQCEVNESFIIGSR